MKLKLSKVNTQYGAPMGRLDTYALDLHTDRVFYLARVYLDSGGYDNGGAYWGHGEPLYRAYSDMDRANRTPRDRVELFVRAKNRTAAKALVREMYPNSYFFR